MKKQRILARNAEMDSVINDKKKNNCSFTFVCIADKICLQNKDGAYYRGVIVVRTTIQKGMILTNEEERRNAEVPAAKLRFISAADSGSGVCPDFSPAADVRYFDRV